jgi:C4-dicarboxylate transporter
MDVLKVLAVLAIIGYVITRQLRGEPLRGKRLILLPAILTVVGIVDLGRSTQHLAAVDIVFIAISAVVAAVFGVWQGKVMRLEARDAVLWGQMPASSLWLWFAFIVARIGVNVVASGFDAHVAASTAPLLVTLGVNRLAQAAMIAPRAFAAGIPFAPEPDGRTFLSGLTRPEQDHSKLDRTDLRDMFRR